MVHKKAFIEYYFWLIHFISFFDLLQNGTRGIDLLNTGGCSVAKLLKEIKTEKRTLVNFKITKGERKTIEKNAKKYTGGNVSHWIRYCALNYKPKVSELKEFKGQK